MSFRASRLAQKKNNCDTWHSYQPLIEEIKNARLMKVNCNIKFYDIERFHCYIPIENPESSFRHIQRVCVKTTISYFSMITSTISFLSINHNLSNNLYKMSSVKSL